MDLWNHIINLKGRTLKTLDRGESFDISVVRENAVMLALHSTGKERRVSRDEIESAFKEMEARGEITRVDIHHRYSVANPAYVVAILASLPGVTYTVRPIHLRYKRRAG